MKTNTNTKKTSRNAKWTNTQWTKTVSVLLAAAMIGCALTACGGDTEDTPDAAETSATTRATTTTTTAETAEDIAETTCVFVTDNSGATVTDENGDAVTEAVPVTYVTVTGEDGAAVTDADGATVTSAMAMTSTTATTAATTAETQTTATTKATAASTKASTQAVAKASTTTKATTAVTKAAAAQTKADNARTTVTNSNGYVVYEYPEDPWKYPYDIDEILRQCKEYTESLGMTWCNEFELNNSSWGTCGNTVSSTYEPETYPLKDEVFGWIDLFYKKGDTGCKVIFTSIPLEGEAPDPYWQLMKDTTPKFYDVDGNWCDNSGAWDIYLRETCNTPGQYSFFVMH